MTDNEKKTASDSDLARLRAEAEIEKLRAETDSLRRPQTFFARNWLPLVTGIGGLVTALGGSAALITALAQFDSTSSYWREKIIEAKQIQLKSGQDALAAQIAEKNARASEQDIAARTDKLRTENEDLELQVKSNAALVEGLKIQALTFQKQIAALQEKHPDPTAAPQRDLVYLQISDNATRASIAGFQELLKSWGFAAPGIELVPRQFDNEVLYFQQGSDAIKAVNLAKSTNDYLDNDCPGHPRLSAKFRQVKAPTAQFEIWVNFHCVAPH